MFSHCTCDVHYKSLVDRSLWAVWAQFLCPWHVLFYLNRFVIIYLSFTGNSQRELTRTCLSTTGQSVRGSGKQKTLTHPSMMTLRMVVCASTDCALVEGKTLRFSQLQGVSCRSGTGGPSGRYCTDQKCHCLRSQIACHLFRRLLLNCYIHIQGWTSPKVLLS